MARSRNPIAFTPLPVTILTTIVYIALFASLIVIHHVVPSAPSSPTPKSWSGVNTTEAWLDLKELSQSAHPYNSRASLDVRAWLLNRIGQILEENEVDWKTVTENGRTAGHKSLDSGYSAQADSKAVTVFDDNASTVLTPDVWSLVKSTGGGNVNYFEGDNIMVYIRGSEDEGGDWWNTTSEYNGLGGVLVNAHYDSVSTAFGATDDGVGVVSVLQLISHFTTEGKQPKKGIVALLNNGEEDGLYGAEAFTHHPLSKFPRTFLNLEGAGAGGRATLFRSTDTEVTKFYADSKYPFGSVVSSDGFKRGVVKSGTDYSVFTSRLGMRGLDLAFMAPRARYHTSQDDARDTSPDSLWHMLSASLATVKGLSDDTSDTFDKPADKEDGEPGPKKGSVAVYFDVLGLAIAVLELHTLFALSITLLVAGPVILIVLEIFIQRSDKWYPFSRKRYLHSSDDDDAVYLEGIKGFFRYPFIFVIAGAAVAALAYLITKINPYILYSSEYAVWTMLLGAWLSVTWFLLRLGDAIRPSALSRFFVLLWIYVLAWIALVVTTIGEDKMDIGSGYFVVIYNAAVFAALLVSYLELFALPKKNKFVEHTIYGLGGASPERAGSIASTRPEDGPSSHSGPDDEAEDANERTSLLNSRQTFTRYGTRHHHSGSEDQPTPLLDDPLLSKAYEHEQSWSSSLPTWTWLLQFILLAPINVILVGQIALFVTSALHQTPADGNSVFTIYILMAAISVLLLLPLAPFLHRMTYHVPTFIFLIFIGTLVYNLTAFPFSRDARLKVFFQQRIELDTGKNSVALVGLEDFTSDIVASLPSAAGQNVECNGNLPWAQRNGMSSCVWEGLAPQVVPSGYKKSGPVVTWGNGTYGKETKKWVEVKASRLNNGSQVVFDIQGWNTRSCRMYFDQTVGNVTVSSVVAGSALDTLSEGGKKRRGGRRGEKGEAPAKSLTADQIKLWSRDWDGRWLVSVSPASESTPALQYHGQKATEDKKSKLEGKVSCLWNDGNQVGVIPALDEVRRFMPVWSTVTKNSDGLVEGWKAFSV